MQITIDLPDNLPLTEADVRIELSAIARHCQVLLLDEPTALLDPDSQLNWAPAVQRKVKQGWLTGLRQKLNPFWIQTQIEKYF